MRYDTNLGDSTVPITSTLGYSWNTVPDNEYEIIEEIHIIRKRVKKSTDMGGTCFIPNGLHQDHCAFDGWDWERHPSANLYCGCRKCSPTY